jgi:hypothetical protein
LKIGGRNCKCLIDPGANVSLIKKELTYKIDIVSIKNVEEKEIQTIASGKEIKSVLITDISQNKKSAYVQFYVIEDMKYEVIIGLDIIQELFQIKINKRNKSLIMNESYYHRKRPQKKVIQGVWIIICRKTGIIWASQIT